MLLRRGEAVSVGFAQPEQVIKGAVVFGDEALALDFAATGRPAGAFRPRPLQQSAVLLV